MSDTASMTFKPGNTIRIFVGPAKDEFEVNGEVMSSSSEFFNAALKKEWAEGQQRSVILAEEDVETFETYLRFLHTGKLPKVEATKGDYPNRFDEPATMLAELYCLGERLLDTAIRNAVLETFVRIAQIEDADNCHWYAEPSHIEIIYNGTSKASPARRLLVTFHAEFGSSTDISKVDNVDFLRDLSCALIEERNDNDGLWEIAVENFRLPVRDDSVGS